MSKDTLTRAKEIYTSDEICAVAMDLQIEECHLIMQELVAKVEKLETALQRIKDHQEFIAPNKELFMRSTTWHIAAKALGESQ